MNTTMLHFVHDRQLAESLSDRKTEAALVTLVSFLLFLLSVFVALSIRECLSIAIGQHQRSNDEMDVPPNEQRSVPSVHSERPRPCSTLDVRRMRILQKRFERRSWYEYYFAKEEFVFTVTAENVVVDTETSVDDDLENGRSKTILVPCGDDKRKPVDGYCAICLTEYEVGDEVVRSALNDCKHVFCSECMLLWLEKGKKRCPICRYWFVPGSRYVQS